MSVQREWAVRTKEMSENEKSAAKYSQTKREKGATNSGNSNIRLDTKYRQQKNRSPETNIWPISTDTHNNKHTQHSVFTSRMYSWWIRPAGSWTTLSLFPSFSCDAYTSSSLHPFWQTSTLLHVLVSKEQQETQQKERDAYSWETGV